MSSFDVQSLFGVNGKVVLVTGGSRGIGKMVRMLDPFSPFAPPGFRICTRVFIGLICAIILERCALKIAAGFVKNGAKVRNSVNLSSVSPSYNSTFYASRCRSTFHPERPRTARKPQRSSTPSAPENAFQSQRTCKSSPTSTSSWVRFRPRRRPCTCWLITPELFGGKSSMHTLYVLRISFL